MSHSRPARPPASAAAPRYVVGIDLGTTNSAVCFVDTTERPWRVRTFPIAQTVAPGVVEPRDGLPSFHYQAAPGELGGGALAGPWSGENRNWTVGQFARDHGAIVPGRTIWSAKSWLCHAAIDRTAAVLPWHAAADVERLSPVEVSGRYLAHIRECWDHRFAGDPLASQDIVLTLPASFDEVARELTVKAASLAGLPRVVLIEEPQAAFYAWIDAHRDDWERYVAPGRKILVCDVGGGTTDLTLIRVRRGEGGKIQFHRVAVGDHLILGGDNMDLALAEHLEQRLCRARRGADGAKGGEPGAAEASEPADSPSRNSASEPPPREPAAEGEKLAPRQWAALVAACRKLKETMLGPDPPERQTIHLPGEGARLIGGGARIEVSRDEVHRVLVEGFFPDVSLDEPPRRRRSGFQEFGLPYAPDPAVTRYLAAFLRAHRHAEEPGDETADSADPARPDTVLFNGGVFNSPVLRRRLLDSLRRWFPGPEPIVLENDRLDLAVARGAAYYGMVRRGEAVRISAALARTYYMGIDADGPPATTGRTQDSSEPATVSGESPDAATRGPAASAWAVCVVPADVEPGQEVSLTDRSFSLRLSEPVEFPLYVSSTRLTDRPGEVVAVDPEAMRALPPIRTVLRSGRRAESGTLEVALNARLTEIGTLELWLSETAGRRTWRLQFDVRAATATDVAAHESAAEAEGFVEESVSRACRAVVAATFGPDGRDSPDGLVKRLAAAAGAPRNAWPISLCRRIWEALMEWEDGRRRSAVHEARWLNLVGFALRPGYGLAVDDWRVAETWRALQGRFAHASPAVRNEGWILWRRVAGGLGAGQQQAVAEPLLGPVRSLHRQTIAGKGRGEFAFSIGETAELWRLLGALELLPIPVKVELGDMLLELAARRRFETVRPAMLWAVGRIGARCPMYGPLNTVVPPELAGAWLLRLMELDAPESALSLMQLARRTDDRYRDLPERLRAKAAAWLANAAAPPHYVELVRHCGALDETEQSLIFGEALPKGLRLR